ncbi:MAG: methyltransferase domain-containing protein [Aquificaceae bacterium]
MKVLSLRFSKACYSYEEWALPQRYSAHRLRSMVDVRGSVLDVGCGTGFMSEGLKTVAGLDIAIGMVKVYRERFGKAVLGDVHNLPFKDKSFDWVLSNFALHWTDINISLPELIRVCRGSLLCALPVEGSLPQLGFPFPRVEDIEGILMDATRIRRLFLEEVPIPFKGWDLIRFFHYTGSSYNPLFNGGIISKKRIEDMIKTIDSTFFKVLFFLCEVKE